MIRILVRFSALTLLATLCFSIETAVHAGDYIRLKGQVVNAASSGTLLGRAEGATTVPFAISLPLRNTVELETLIKQLYDPADPLYGHYLSPAEFTDRFGPTQADYDAVKAYAVAHGFTVSGEHANRTILDVRAPVSTVEASLGVNLLQYQAASGRLYHRTDSEPAVPIDVAGRIRGIVGLDTAPQMRPHGRVAAGWDSLDTLAPRAATGGSGPGGAFSPSDIATAYSIPHTSTTGSGQILAVFELDGYNASDIAAYESYFGLPAVPIENVLIDGATGTIQSSGGGAEVTLDLELMLGIAPGAAKIICYQTKNSAQGVLDGYNQIATENRARVISTSWGLAETEWTSSFLNAEYAIFQQMAAQGQTLVAAAGDAGAYDNYDSASPSSATLSVDDPASQPYVVGVGGTQLVTASAGGAYSSETTWNGGSAAEGAGGGGVSVVWSIPSWQKSVVTAASGASSTMRNVPDVAINGDPNTPYAIYYNGAWHGYGGTSAGSPIWSAFLAIANQQRLTAGLANLGHASPWLYSVGASATYSTDFHDISDGSTNLYYKAVSGYDMATGLGSMSGTILLAELAPVTVTNAAPTIISLSPTSATAGSAAFTLTVSGTGFVSGAAVTLGGTTLTTTYVSATKLTAAVPASVVSTVGSYSVTVTNPSSGGVASNALTFNVTAPATLHTFAAGLQIIAAPLDASGYTLSQIFSLSTIKLAAWDAASAAYAVSTTSPADTIRPGRGYWARLVSETALYDVGTHPATSTPLSVPLYAGWNLVGNPRSVALAASTLSVSTSTATTVSIGTAATAGVVDSVVYGYQPGDTAYEVLGVSSSTLPAYAGFWLYAYSACTLLFP
ncbi:MAG TPA: S53 family peptidase [Capsulimonadaceae bacterium]|jgi:kumamolisin